MYCLLLSNVDFFLLLIAEIILFFYYKREKYEIRIALTYCAFFAVIFYFSLNMATEVVTADEPMHEIGITNVREIKNLSYAEPFLNQYKLSQLTIGTIFLIIPSFIKELLGSNGIWMVYKALHWFLTYIFALATTKVWKKWIIIGGGGHKNRITENIVLAILIGLPLACLLFKVVNYDSGSTYPAILGISMLCAAYKTKDTKLGIWGTVISGLCPLEKLTALPYWIISVILFALMECECETKYIGKVIKTIRAVAISFVSILAVSVLYFIFAFFQQNGFCKTIGFKEVVFSYSHSVNMMIFGDTGAIAENSDVICFFLLFFLTVICVLLVDLLSFIILKSKGLATRIYFKLDAVLLLTGIVGGVIATYFIPLRISPFLPIEDGYYISPDSFGGVTYHFGVKTAIGHFVAKLCYMWAVIINSYPTAIIILLIIVSIFILKNMDEGMYFYSLILSSSFALQFLYAISGLPFDARYYSFSVFWIVLVYIYIAYKKLSFRRILIILGAVIYCCEMCMYVPNVKNFSPVWVWHDETYNSSVRVGQWHAGEGMLWGEEFAIAGRFIKADVLSRGLNFSDVNIYSNYQNYWPANPGFNVVSEISDLEFDDSTYIVLNKFMLYRSEIPEFIDAVKPIETIKFKGEICAWIYRADQLDRYKEYFKN